MNSIAESDIKELENQYEVSTYDRFPYVLSHGHGTYLYDTEGKELIDLYGGHCVSILGHTPDAVVNAIKDQAGKLLFYSNVAWSPIRGLTAQKLVSMAPASFNKVFFCNSGTEANENALKIAWKLTGTQHVIAMEGGFHGRTLASLAVSYGTPLREPYETILPPVSFTPFGNIEALEKSLHEHKDTAAVIMEPIQSMAGVVSANKKYFREVRKLCDDHGVFLIFDEVQTGIGRTGTFSYSEQLDIVPDIITLAKSLGSGIPVGAVLLPDKHAQHIKTGDLGTTFGGGMMAMASTLATLEEIEQQHYMEHAVSIYETIEKGLSETDITVRGAGCLIGLVFDTPVKELRMKLMEKGWLTGSAKNPNVIRLMPPINTPLDIIEKFVSELKNLS